MTNTPRRNPRWRDLPQKEKAAEASILLTATKQDAYSFTLNRGSVRVDRARAAAKRFVTHVHDTLRYHLEQRLGRVPPFWFVIEDLDKDGNAVDLHVHGVIAIEPGEKSTLKQAFLEVAGRDTDRARALKLQRHDRPKHWAKYCFKNLHKGDPECTGFAMERGLRQAARRDHDQRRQARLHAAESHRHAGGPTPAPLVSPDAAKPAPLSNPSRPISVEPAAERVESEPAQTTVADNPGGDLGPLEAFLD